jgi:hypothetical protein
VVETVKTKLAETGKGKGTYATAAVLVIGGVLVATGKVSPAELGLTDGQIEGLVTAAIGVGLAFLRRAIGSGAK